VLPDIEIAKMMLKKNNLKKKTAPYAWDSNGQVRPEYRHVLKKHIDEIEATEQDKKRSSPRGYDFEEWTREKIEMVRQQRAEKALASRWEISLKVARGYKPKFRCRLCTSEVESQSSHVKNVKHNGKKPEFDLVSIAPPILILSIITDIKAHKGSGSKYPLLDPNPSVPLLAFLAPEH
jgi:hypothetical protein